MIDAMDLFLALAGALTGGAAGLLHFRTLRRAADALVRGAPMGQAIGLGALRFGVTIAVFLGAALLGAPALIGAALGFAAGRRAVLRAARGETA